MGGKGKKKYMQTKLYALILFFYASYMLILPL